MKFGLVRRGYSASGGAEAYLRRFADGLVHAGCEVALFTSEKWPREVWPHELYKVSGGGDFPLEFADALVRMSAESKCDLLFSLERLHSCDCYRAGDGVHRAWLERRAKHEPWFKPLWRKFSQKHRELLTLEASLFSNNGARCVIANSSMVAEEINGCYNYPAANLHVVYNGVPAPLAEPDMLAGRVQTRHALKLSDEEFVVLFAGSGWDRKGLRWAIEAMAAAKMDHATLLVAGRGDANAMPRTPHVVFLGEVREMPRHLAAADAFILPTIYDPFSNACLEALSYGLPVITTKHNGFAEIITAEEGDVVAEPDDVPALAAALRRWSDPALREAARPRLLEKGTHFSIEENVRHTLDILTKL